MHSFVANAVTVAYKGGARAIRQFDIEFSGDCLAVVGGEKDGKTTLVSALAGLTSYEGEFVLDGKPLSRKPAGDKVQAILEDYSLLPHKTVRQNLEYPLKIRKIPADEIKKRIDALIAEFGLEPYEKVRTEKLAPNIKPYVAVARLTLIPRELYVFDDILKPLRDADRENFLLKIKQIFSRLDGLKIFCTSNIDEAKALADKIVVLYGGVIEQYGSYDDLLEFPSSVKVAEIMSRGNVEFKTCIMREFGGRIMVNTGGGSVTLEDDSVASLLDKSFIGREVQVALYRADDVTKYLIMDTETDKTILI